MIFLGQCIDTLKFCIVPSLSLTVSIQSIKLRVSSNDVCLSFKWRAKRMLPSTENVVTHTTGREDVNCNRLTQDKHSHKTLSLTMLCIMHLHSRTYVYLMYIPNNKQYTVSQNFISCHVA